MSLLERAGLGQQSRPGRHAVEILVASSEIEGVRSELLMGFGTRVVNALEICHDPDLTAEEKVAAIQQTLSGGAFS